MPSRRKPPQTATAAAPPAVAVPAESDSRQNPLPFLLILPFISRILTFALNQSLLRTISPTVLGLSLQLELLLSSTLYFARESLRCALLRTDRSKPGALQRAINLCFACIPLGVLFADVLGGMYFWKTKKDGEGLDPSLVPALVVTMIAAILELASEPVFLLVQLTGNFGLRARAEGLATILRAATFSVLPFYTDLGLLSFGIGHLVYSASLLSTYILTGAHSYPFPGRPEDSKELVDASQVSLSATMWSQSALRHLLAQADSLLFTLFATPAEQGTFGFAANYGALLARLIFAPIEESSRAIFSRPRPASSKGGDPQTSFLRTLLHLYALLGLVASAIAPPLTPFLVNIIAGAQFRTPETANVLGAYCYYIPLLAFNGILEAYVQSRASPVELGKQSFILVLTSGAMFGLGLGALKFGWGAVGLVAVNCGCMLVRIIWCVGFLRRDIGSTGWEGILPSGGTILSAVTGGAALRLANIGIIQQFGIIGVVGILCLFFERRFLISTAQTIGGSLSGKGSEVRNTPNTEKNEL